MTSGLRAVTATVGGLFTGAGIRWDAAHQNARLKHERELMLQRIVEAKAISLENRELKAALQLREHSRSTSREPHRGILLQQPAPLHPFDRRSRWSARDACMLFRRDLSAALSTQDQLPPAYCSSRTGLASFPQGSFATASP